MGLAMFFGFAFFLHGQLSNRVGVSSERRVWDEGLSDGTDVSEQRSGESDIQLCRDLRCDFLQVIVGVDRYLELRVTVGRGNRTHFSSVS